MLELDLNAQEIIEKGIETEGSNLGGVSAKCSWIEKDFDIECSLHEQSSIIAKSELGGPRISEQESQQIKSELKKGLLSSKPGINNSLIKTEEFEDFDRYVLFFLRVSNLLIPFGKSINY